MQNIENRPLAFYTQTAGHLVCSPQGNNCQILIIVMLTRNPIISSCTIQPQQVFCRREQKLQQQGDAKPHPLLSKLTK